MYQPSPAASAMAPRPQAIPTPAAAPELRPEELLCDGCCIGGDAVVGVDETVAGRVGSALNDEDGEDVAEIVLVVDVEAVLKVMLELAVALVVEIVNDEPTVAVSNISRFNGTVSPSDASGWLSQADCMVSRTEKISFRSARTPSSLTISQHNRSII